MNINKTAKRTEIKQDKHIEADKVMHTETDITKHTEIDQAALNKAVKRAYAVLPLYLAVPLLFWAVFRTAGYDMDWKAFGLGALGWTIALMLRGPISVLVKKMPQERGHNIIGLSSGVLEESIRLIVLALTSTAAGWALSVGQGWAAVEVVFTMLNIFLIASLVNRTDEKAMQVKQLLAAQGTIHANPLWGVLERIWASAFHIGSTLVIASEPWAVILLIVLHSGLNWCAVRLARRSIRLSSALIAVVGAAMLGVGLALII